MEHVADSHVPQLLQGPQQFASWPSLRFITKETLASGEEGTVWGFMRASGRAHT